MRTGAGHGRGERAQTHRAPGLLADPLSVCSCWRPWGATSWGWWACWSGWGCCCVNWAAWRAPSPGPRRTGSVGGGGCGGEAMLRSVFPRAAGWRSGSGGAGRALRSVERCHWRRGQVRDLVSLQPQLGRPTALGARRPREPASVAGAESISIWQTEARRQRTGTSLSPAPALP